MSTAVDIFGDCDAFGKKGAAGEDGEDSLDICRWFPLESLTWLRNTAQCCYYFETYKDFIIKDGKIVGFKSHSSEREIDAISLKDPVIKVIFGRGYCAEFVNSLIEIPNTDIAMKVNSFTFLVITFKMTRIPDSEMIIVSNEKSDRGLYVNLNKFGILGSIEEISWEYILKKWYTIAIQWTRNDKDNSGYVYFKGKRGDFTTIKPEAQSHSLFMGGLKDERKRLMPWTGCLALLEIYTYLNEDEFPAKFRNLIIEDHKRRIHES